MVIKAIHKLFRSVVRFVRQTLQLKRLPYSVDLVYERFVDLDPVTKDLVVQKELYAWCHSRIEPGDWSFSLLDEKGRLSSGILTRPRIIRFNFAWKEERDEFDNQFSSLQTERIHHVIFDDANDIGSGRFGFYLLKPEIIKWLEDNIKHNWSCNRFYDTDTKCKAIVFFENETDALLFKLAWKW